jgi:hypothetical protein
VLGPDDDYVVLRDPEGNCLCVCALSEEVPPDGRDSWQVRRFASVTAVGQIVGSWGQLLLCVTAP